jgi:hypothetical protein
MVHCIAKKEQNKSYNVMVGLAGCCGVTRGEVAWPIFF